MRSRLFYVFLGIMLIILFINISKINAQPVDNLSAVFDKDYYAVDKGNTIDVTYTLTNNNDEDIDLYIYSDCQDDIRCNYSKNITLNAFSSFTDVVLVNGKDYGTETLKLVVIDQSQEQKEFLQTINVDRDYTRGDISLDLNTRNLCVGKANELLLEMENDFASGIYDISFRTTTIGLSLKEANPRYYSYGDHDILLNAVVNDSQDILSSEKVIVRIESQEALVVKEINFYFSECDTYPTGFSVSRPSYESFLLNKDEQKVVDYIVYNNSDYKKIIYISEQSDSEVSVAIDKREITINPRSSKKVEVTLFSEFETSSGNYDVNLSFFDGFKTVTKKLNILLNAEYNLFSRIIPEENIALKIGDLSEVTLVLENKGDISESFDILTTIDNDLRTDLSQETVRVDPGKTAYIKITVSAGPSTQEKTSNLIVRVVGINSNYSKTYNLNVHSFREKPPVTLNILSIPTEIEISSGREVDFEMVVENFYDQDLYLDRIEIRNLPSSLSYELPREIVVPGLEQINISGKIVAEDLPAQEIDAEIVFISRDGGQLTRPLKISIITTEPTEEEQPKRMTGFFTLGNSFLLGLVVLCFIIILLYATKVIKHKK